MRSLSATDPFDSHIEGDLSLLDIEENSYPSSVAKGEVANSSARKIPTSPKTGEKWGTQLPSDCLALTAYHSPKDNQ